MKKWLIGGGAAWLTCLLVMGAVTPVSTSNSATNSRISIASLVGVPAAYAAVPTPVFSPILLRNARPTATATPPPHVSH